MTTKTPAQRIDELHSDPIMHLRSELARAFGLEWVTLPASDRALILRDCTEEVGVSDIAEYRRNIGRGNLASYVKCMRVRFSH